MACYGGVDDGFFKRGWSKTVAVLSVHCEREEVFCPCSFYAAPITVDGSDATAVIVELIRSALSDGFALDVVLLDTVVFAGFNIAVPWRVWEDTGIPVIVVLLYPPNAGAAERALMKLFSNHQWRIEVLRRVWSDLFRVECSRGSLYAAAYGVERGRAWSLLCSLQRFTRQPEPLYTAHIVASSLSPLLKREGELGGYEHYQHGRGEGEL